MSESEIIKLDEAVINRIAAGEIIQRPANCLKEMLENSLDAKSTYIQVIIKNGGLKLLQIQDNGTGIRKKDLEIVCERFTTSKLKTFEDLTEIATFGFRGEALSSISHVAHLTIQTKTNKEQCAYKASYVDGKLKDAPKPCAGNQGTIITVEDLFYNVPQRKQVLKSPSEEFQKISDVITKYAVHNAKVGFMLKKSGEQPSIKTPTNSIQSENIKIIFGHQISKELIEIGFTDSVHKFITKGFVTNVNYSGKKSTLLIFINHRLVESANLKLAIDSVYSTYLCKGSHPFVYISLELYPHTVDVNVHPTKHEVHFLNEDDIIDKIKFHIEAKLLTAGGNSARTFYKQMRLPGSSEIDDTLINNISIDKVQPKDMIRTDSREQKLDKFLITEKSMKIIKTEQCSSTQSPKIVKRETKLTSVINMRKDIENSCSEILKKIIRELVFIGVVDSKYAIFQHENKLFMVDTKKLSNDLFYQLIIYNFQNFQEIHFEPKLSVLMLLEIALDSEESGWTEEDGPKSELAQKGSEILIEKSPIMAEYFSIKINENGLLESLPILLEYHTPEMCKLPNYLLRLATEVEWDDEVECFKTFCNETANFYSYLSELDLSDKSNSKKQNQQWFIENCLYPALKKTLIPHIKLKKYFYELASLSNLYKVFERC